MKAEPLRLCVVSTSRSDLGLLLPVVRAASADPRFTARLVVTGTHLAEGTPDPAELAGVASTRLPRPADSLGLVHQQALLTSLVDTKTEAVLLLGDRLELLEALLPLVRARVAIAHCSGGETTAGAWDDLVRDAVTRLAHLHYPAHEHAGASLRARGEQAWRIAVVGEPGLDAIRTEPRMSPEALAGICGRVPTRDDLLVAVHPVTGVPGELETILEAVSGLAETWPGALFLSSPNGDPGSDDIRAAWTALARAHSRVVVLGNHGAAFFRSLTAACAVVVGNSSSGLVEAPSLGTPTVDVGSRQGGRLRGPSVVDCPAASAVALLAATRTAIAKRTLASMDTNPYGDGRAVPRLLDHLWATARRADVLIKP